MQLENMEVRNACSLFVLLPCDLILVSTMGQFLSETGACVMHSTGQKMDEWRMNKVGRQTKITSSGVNTYAEQLG